MQILQNAIFQVVIIASNALAAMFATTGMSLPTKAAAVIGWLVVTTTGLMVILIKIEEWRGLRLDNANKKRLAKK